MDKISRLFFVMFLIVAGCMIISSCSFNEGGFVFDDIYFHNGSCFVDAQDNQVRLDGQKSSSQINYFGPGPFHVQTIKESEGTRVYFISNAYETEIQIGDVFKKGFVQTLVIQTTGNYKKNKQSIYYIVSDYLDGYAAKLTISQE